MYIRRKVFSIAHDENGEEKLFSTTDYQSQKEFASVRVAKKMAKKAVNSVLKNGLESSKSRKELGRINAIVDRRGIKNSEKIIESRGAEKVIKGLINPLEKNSGRKLSKEDKEIFVRDVKDRLKENAKGRIR